MKKIALIIGICCSTACHFRRPETPMGAYAKMPSFNFRLLDSVTIFNTREIPSGDPVLFMYFSPDCEHCQEQTKALLTNINSLKNTKIYLFSPMSLNELRGFTNTYHLRDYKNIIVGNDYEYAFFRIFKVKSYPYTVIYDSHRNLVKLYKGKIGFERISKASGI